MPATLASLTSSKKKSCPHCGLAANSHQSLGIPTAGVGIPIFLYIGAAGGIQPASLGSAGMELPGLLEKVKLCSKDTAAAASPASPRLPLPCGGAARSSPASHTDPSAHPTPPGNPGICHCTELGDGLAFTGLNVWKSRGEDKRRQERGVALSHSAQ